MEKILLRRATVNDARAIFEVTKSAFEIYSKSVGRNVAALNEKLCDVENDIVTKNVFVCDIDTEVTGAVRFEELGAGICYLSRFATNPKMQNLGIGSLLIEKAKHECLQTGTKAIVLYTASKMISTLSFYLRNGYYIHSTDERADYIRLLLVNEFEECDEAFDYEGLLRKFGY